MRLTAWNEFQTTAENSWRTKLTFRGLEAGVISTGNAVPIVEKLPQRMETEFSLLKCLRTHYGRHCEPFSGPKMYTAGFCRYNLKIIPGVIPPVPCKNVPGAWTPTPISAWLASVPIVPVLQNDHCLVVRAAATGKTRSPTVDNRVRRRSVMTMTQSEDDLKLRGPRAGGSRRWGIVGEQHWTYTA